MLIFAKEQTIARNLLFANRIIKMIFKNEKESFQKIKKEAEEQEKKTAEEQAKKK